MAIYHDHLGRSNQVMQFLKQTELSPYWMGITIFKSSAPSPQSTSVCTRDDVTIVRTWRKIQMNIFHEFESMNGFIPPLCMSTKLSEVCNFKLSSEIWHPNRGIPVAIVTLHIWISPTPLKTLCGVDIIRGLCSDNARLFNVDVTAGSPIVWEGIPKLRTAPSC